MHYAVDFDHAEIVEYFLSKYGALKCKDGICEQAFYVNEEGQQVTPKDIQYVKIKDIVLRSIAKGSWRCLSLLLAEYNHDP